MMPAWILTLAAMASGVEDAETCLRTKVWEGYAEGWGVRTMTSTELASGKTHNYRVTLYAGNTYKMLGCATKEARNLDILLYSSKGELIARDDQEDREPVIEFEPTATGTYYVLLYLQESTGPRAGAALAMSYR